MVAVFAPLQHSPRCIMVHQQSGIRRLQDLQHVTLAMNSSSTFSLYLQKKLPLTGVRIVPYAGNVAQFVLNRDLAQQAYVFSEPYVARLRGCQPHTLLVSELGFDPYTSVLVTHPETIRSQPDLVRRMVAAAQPRLAAVPGGRDPANQAIAAANAEMDEAILAYGAEQLKALCVDQDTPAERLGRMTLSRWQALVEQLTEVGALPPDSVEPQQVFTTEFLPEAG